MSISEANIGTNFTDYYNQFCNFNFELNKMYNTIGLSRYALLVNKQIAYKRRLDLDHPNICTIWIEVKPKKGKKIIIMGGYRHWKLPLIIDPDNKKEKNIKQLERLKIMLEQWQTAINENKDVIVITDNNLDSNPGADHNKIHKVQNLYDLLFEHLTQNNITTHNYQFTRHQANTNPSIIDHIYSNCKGKLRPVETIKTLYSDHCILKTSFISSQSIYNPKFMRIRNYKLLTKTRLTKYFNENEMLNTVFNFNDPNIIAEIIQIEINSIIESIAPSKHIQCANNYMPYLDEDMRIEIMETNKLLTDAITSKDTDKWRLYRHKRNLTQKNIKNKKREYLQEKFSTLKDKWKFLKKYTNSNKQAPPDKINLHGEIITSPRILAQITNEFFIKKIENIRKSFTWTKVTPIEILTKLIPRSENELKIPLMTVDEMNGTIKGLKNSSSCGHDNINNKIIIKKNYLISPHLTHLVNNILINNTVPDIFKLSRILPLSKPDRNREKN